MRIESWAKTDVGRQRIVNEDCHYIDPDNELILVLDGMGGHKAGEVASRLAMETIADFFKNNATRESEASEIIDNLDSHFTFYANLLRQATFEANRVVLQKSMEDRELLGMGCTLTAMAIHESTAAMINVGDSRTYLIRNGHIEQISRDHTLAEDQVERGIMTREEARDSQLRHILSSVIGVDPKIRVHLDEIVLQAGDLLLLCTDGLTAVMTDDEILNFLIREKPGPEMLDKMVDVVNDRGGPDNVTMTITAVENTL